MYYIVFLVNKKKYIFFLVVQAFSPPWGGSDSLTSFTAPQEGLLQPP